ncbi:L-seryl-tRNA(Sec) selenium transferase [Caloramator quimbayensis]|uniref:L-seryl-tRNA(Sec) selenium transferase n=1 Tax=Caloramator quimbayensis TaxID=1147123 RepID=A0A1T4XYU3_9CLOT|nr:L-seryl-tRNA(Sec) selenium transferase [Caloramator quimbayensis]SKA94724.1 L-seryl-tRNA(Sec) selenium transferase [Caloramator quimbayensis]
MESRELLSYLPKVDVLLNDINIISIKDVSRNIVLESVRETIDEYRKKILSGELKSFEYEDIVNDVLIKVKKKSSMHLKRVINATGTVLHTNLGRAVLSKSAIDAVINAASRYSNLEFDLEKGVRGSRYSHVEELICKITGAEAAMVVNNNAAAVMLVLSTLSKGKEAIVSRGQLVEIGGSFRVPAVMEQSGARLVEVGTTNRTHLYDYENAINDNTGVILKVHQSNYKILGFTEEVSIEDLMQLGKKYDIPVVEDIGSGVFIDMVKYGLTYEPTVQESIKKGIDVVTFSGDKMLGGPQAGIIAGKKKYIDKMKKNQLTRALRIDKMTLAALEATLRLYLDESTAINEIIVLRMLTLDIETLRKSAQKLSKMLKSRLKDFCEVEIIKEFSQVGGGAMPLENLETYVVAIKPLNMSLEKMDYLLRSLDVPIIGRIYKDRMLFDVRTLFEEEYKIIADSLYKISQE